MVEVRLERSSETWDAIGIRQPQCIRADVGFVHPKPADQVEATACRAVLLTVDRLFASALTMGQNDKNGNSHAHTAYL